MGDVTEANIERILTKVNSLQPKIDQSDADDKLLLTEELASIKAEMKSMLEECQETQKEQAAAIRIYQAEMAILLGQIDKAQNLQ